MIEREGAAIAALISLEEPTAAMRKEAASAGFYKSPWGEHPRLQLRTVAEMLDRKGLDEPPSNVTHKKAPKAQNSEAEMLKLPLAAEGEPPYGDEDPD